MRLLYATAESARDVTVFAALAEAVRGEKMTLVPMRNRRGDGITEFQRQIKYALLQARAAAGSGGVAFLAACDNERTPHPENAGPLDRGKLPADEAGRASRRDWLLGEVESVLGANRAAWPLDVALAVPVEMLESWIVRVFHPKPYQPPRHFSKADSQSAREYYRPLPPPQQWKDLCTELQGERGFGTRNRFTSRRWRNSIRPCWRSGR